MEPLKLKDTILQVQSEQVMRAIGAIGGVLILGTVVMLAVVIFAVKLGENIMNYGS